MENERNYADGMNVFLPRENAPDFVVCDISVDYERFISWGGLNLDENGRVKLSVVKQKSNPLKTSVFLNTYKPKEEGIPQQKPTNVHGEDLEENIPF